MTFKPAIWRPITIVLSALNLVGVGFAAAEAEPWHAAVHAALALAFGLGAQRLGRGGGPIELRAGLEALDGEVSRLRQEMSEVQERLDFAERVLAQPPESRRGALEP